MLRVFPLLCAIGISISCCTPQVGAEILRPFPGVAALCKEAQVVALVKVESRAVIREGSWTRLDQICWKTYDPSWGLQSGPYQHYFISTIRVLKGATDALPDGVVDLYMVDPGPALPIRAATPPVEDRKENAFVSNHLSNPREGDYALVFLGGTVHDLAGAPPLRRCCNCPGSFVAISKETATAKYPQAAPLQRVVAVLRSEMKRNESRPEPR